MESITLTILRADDRVVECEARIQSAFEEILKTAVPAINAHSIDVVVGINPSETIPETGVGGVTCTPHIIFVWIDPDHENLRENFEYEMKSTFAHELHHAMRNRAHPWPGTLLDDIVGEGLADHFDLEINGGDLKPWATALPEGRLEEMYSRAEKLFFEEGDGYPDWFFGSIEKNIPKWTGYSLGYKIVGDYLERTGKSASELVDLNSEEFISSS